MTIYKELKKDHDEVKSILSKLETDINNTEYLEDLKKELGHHNPAEEKTFYKPLASKVPSLKSIISSGKEEHDMVEELIKKFSKFKGPEKEKKILLSVITKSLLAHIDMEENEIFEIGKDAFTNDEAKLIAENFSAQKEKIKSKQ